MPKKLPDRSAARPCPDGRLRDRPPWEKVTFHIGSSVSPESDFESRTKAMEERLQACRCAEPEPAQGPLAGPGVAADPAQEGQDQCSPTCSRSPGASAGDRDVRTEAAAEVAGVPGAPASPTGTLARPGGWRGKDADVPAVSRCTAPVPSGDASFRVEGGLPRNESSDSALGDSDDDTCAAASPDLGPGSDPDVDHDQSEGSLEVELPLPRSQSISNPNVRNFGRSLLAGYCPTYMPDLVLHGTSSDEKLKQCLAADLVHTVQHPVLDEPIAEAVCIIADTDKWSVQVATSQRKAVDSTKLGQDVLVSSQVSSLLQSILQLYRLHLPADFCVMHLEDRLQEMYLKSKMLSEYLRGHTRVHVKELSVVLGIESNDLPLLTAIASTHSPYVAQILL